jgi:hypothetical protein
MPTAMRSPVSRSCRRVAPAVGLALAALLSACTEQEGTGYVEVKLTPPGTASQFVILLDRQQIRSTNSGPIVLRRNVGHARLELERRKDERVTLCDLAVKKNRITSVTVHFQNGTLRCYIEAV